MAFYQIKCKEGTLPIGYAEKIGENTGNFSNYKITNPAKSWEIVMGFDGVNPVTWHLENGNQIQCKKAPTQGFFDINFLNPQGTGFGIQSFSGYIGEVPKPTYQKTSTIGVYMSHTPGGSGRSFDLLYTQMSVFIREPSGAFIYGAFNSGNNKAGQNFSADRKARPFSKLYEFCEGSIKPAPHFPGDDNGQDPGGGDGDGELEDNPIEVPEDPTITAADAGLLTLYAPTLGQVHSFGRFLWSDAFSLDSFKKLFADPMQAVIGLSVVPVSVPTSGSQNIQIGSVDSGVLANRASSQYVRKDCGSLAIKPIWNTALDYSPYTKFSIFLPFIGTRELKTDDIMGKTLNVTYLVDILSGACTAHISVNNTVLYQFSGSCSTPVPITGASWSNLITSAVQLAGAGIAAVATSGASTAASAAAVGATVSGTAGLVASAKPNIQRTGAVSGAAGMLGVKTPYLIRETPRQSLAEGYAHFVGYPSNISSTIGALEGFTQVEKVHLENIHATSNELAEIESKLKEGVII